MEQERIDSTRYRTLIVGLFLSFVLTLAATLIAARLPGARWYEWAPFLVAALLFVAMMPVAVHGRRIGSRRMLERIAAFMLVVAGVAMLQRMAWTVYGHWLSDPAANPFRPVFHFTPFFYISAVALIRARRALQISWAAWLLVVVVTLPGLYQATGFRLEREGELLLLVWLLLANPLFILLLNALPRYEEALEASNAEVLRMRERTELMERLGEGERRFNLVVDSLQVGVWDRWLGPPERRWWSPRFYELIGYSAEELEASEASLLGLMHPDEREEVWKRGTRQLMQGDILDVDFRLRTKHRGYRWFNSHAKAERDAQGRMVRIAGGISDIHEQRCAERALHEAKAELTRLAYRDTLTDLHNRRAFDERFEQEWERCRRTATPLSLLLIDLDHFKLYNDSYGHTAGDECLRRVAQAIAGCARGSADFAARLGGEEFAMLLPAMPAEGALAVAGSIGAALGALAIAHSGSPLGKVTASIGVATAGASDSAAKSLFERADRAMYEVKRRGRNAVLLDQEPAAV